MRRPSSPPYSSPIPCSAMSRSVRALVLAQLGDLGPPLRGDDRGDGKAALGVADGRCERLRQRDRPEAAEQGVPSRQGARNRHVFDAFLRHRGVALREQRVTRHETPGATAAVEPVQPAVLGRPHHGEHVSADSGHLRLHHVEHGGGRDRRVDGVAAAREHGEARGGREGLARGDHAVRRVHRRAVRQRGGTGRLLRIGRSSHGKEQGGQRQVARTGHAPSPRRGAGRSRPRRRRCARRRRDPASAPPPPAFP